MLTLFGAHDVAILDGGLAKWKAEGRPLENGKPSLRHRHFTVWKDDSGVKTKADMLANLHSKDAVDFSTEVITELNKNAPPEATAPAVAPAADAKKPK